MKRIFFPLLFLLFSLSCFAAISDTLTIEYCYQQAYRTYPVAGQKDMLDQASTLRITNLNKNYLPTVNINGSATLQSEVTEITIIPPPPIPAISGPEISKDWYKLTLDVNEYIYEGNVTAKQKRLEKASLLADQKGVDVELYKLKDRINQLYFSIFFMQQNVDILLSTQKLLESRLKEVKAGVAGGTMMSSSADALQVELIRITQQLEENRIGRESSFKMLSELISEQIPPTTRLILPEVKISSMQFENKRPEYELFTLQSQRVDYLKSMVITKWNPKFAAFGQAGYGRPGLNMLSNDFTPWWIVGARFTWNILNWNQNKNERQILDIQSQIIKTNQETFDKNLRINSEKDISEILRLTEVVQQDDEIVSLRERITKTAYSQMQNGIITSSEYVSRLNDEVFSKVTRELHQIQLVKAKQDYLFTLGKL